MNMRLNEPDEWPAPWTLIGEEMPPNADALYESACLVDAFRAEMEREGMDEAEINQWLKHRWLTFLNRETQYHVFARCETLLDANKLVTVKIGAVVFPLDWMSMDEADGRGANPTDFPIREIERILTWRKRRNVKEIEKLAKSIPAIVPPFRPIKETETTEEDEFLYLVAQQYIAVENTYPDDNPVKRMAQINDAGVSTVQRWLTKARKAGLLKPRPRGRRKNSDRP